MSFRITGLDPTPFRPLYGLPDEELARLGVKRALPTQAGLSRSRRAARRRAGRESSAPELPPPAGGHAL